MGICSLHRCAINPLLLAFVFLTLCSPNVWAQGNTLFLDSQPGDTVLNGQRLTHNSPADAWTVALNGNRIEVRVVPAGTWAEWQIEMRAADGQTLVPGVYTNTWRSFSGSFPQPLLSVSGPGGGCSQNAGRFTILELVLDGTQRVTRFAADFE